ncbi:LamG-like jellyroll fold domain-containing protein [Candidatus Nitrososphaera gargensis]|uniref:LamG-like jellyroll fold domain-containing protein n=1 Tax=Candidatus Nitrososphaera gargensis TaxID=497727 RepID=UPI0011E5379F|nr:LamG-like jellyroll fold domain-containing protein [Candidatus Nitrososphaera gargensis]
MVFILIFQSTIREEHRTGKLYAPSGAFPASFDKVTEGSTIMNYRFSSVADHAILEPHGRNAIINGEYKLSNGFLKLVGNKSNISISDFPEINTENIAFSLNLKITNIGSRQALLVKGYHSELGYGQYGINIEPNGKLRLIVRSDNGNNLILYSNKTLTEGTAQVGFVITKSSAAIYIDGHLEKVGEIPSHLLTSNQKLVYKDLTVGNQPVALNEVFRGGIIKLTIFQLQ